MIKVAAIQVSASTDVERNLKKAGQYLEAASERGARLACFPELFAFPWFPGEIDEESFRFAQPADGAVASEVAAMAARAGIAVVCPLFEKAADGVYYNSALLFDAAGRRVGTYRKIHVPHIPHWHEQHYFSPGDRGFPVFEVEGLRIGVQLGWDAFFPEGFRALALQGAQAVFLPTAAAFASLECWLAMAVSHAVANGLYVLRVNRVGSEAGLDFYGSTFAVRPDGELSADPIGMGEGVLLAECDVTEVERCRRTWPFLKDRRPRQYAKVAGVEYGASSLPEEPGPGRDSGGTEEG